MYEIMLEIVTVAAYDIARLVFCGTADRLLNG